MHCLAQLQSGMEEIGEGWIPKHIRNDPIPRSGGGRLAGGTAEVVLFRLTGFPRTGDAVWVRFWAGFYGWPC